MTAPSALVNALRDRYVLEGLLGTGGMATVYAAHDIRNARRVAVKVMRPELAAVIGAERFLAEVRTTANLQHPHILPLFDSGDAESFLFYVMPYVEGESLRNRLTREKQLPIRDATRIACEVASALDYAHRHGVIHRDIKPENILLHDGTALVADFGIALAASKAGGERITETGMSLGTPFYMSPEQALGEREITGRTDIYALGAVTHEMLVGEPPFTGPTAQSIVAKLLTEVPRPLRPKRHTIPPHVEEAVLNALQKLPADRFATATEFMEALEGRQSISATAPMRAAGRRRRAPSGWSLVLGAGLGALLTALLFLGYRKSPETVEHWSIAPLPSVDTIPLPRILALSPDGTKLAYIASDPAGRRMLHVRPLERPDGTPLSGTEEAIYPTFAPDGRKIAFLAPPGRLKWISTDGGSSQTLAVARGRHLCWSRDGYIYFPRPDADTLPAGLSRIREGGGQPEAVTTVDSARGELDHACYQVFPSGRGLMYDVGRAGGASVAEIAAYSFDTRRRQAVLNAVYAQLTPESYIIHIDPGRTLLASRFDERTLRLTSPPVTLADNVYLNPDAFAGFVLSESGTLLYSSMTPRVNRLVWVDRTGRMSVIEAPPHGQLESASLSPDGRFVAAQVFRNGVPELATLELPNGPWTQLVRAGGDDSNFRPSWHRSGAQIAFIMARKDGVRVAWGIASDGSGAPVLLREASPIAIQEVEWSPDGEWLIYRQGPSGPTQRDILYVRPHAGSAAHPVATTVADEFAPTVSPDGQWLAYVSNASGREEVMVQPFPGPGRRIQVSLEGGFEPRWAHSGREIFYRDRAGNLVSVEVSTRDRFTTGRRRTLFPAAGFLNDRNSIQYDVAPGDQRFLFIQPVSGGEVSWRLVRNFLAEVRARLSE